MEGNSPVAINSSGDLMCLPTLDSQLSRNSRFSRVDLRSEKRHKKQTSLSSIELSRKKEEEMKSKNLTELLAVNLSTGRPA